MTQMVDATMAEELRVAVRECDERCLSKASQWYGPSLMHRQPLTRPKGGRTAALYTRAQAHPIQRALFHVDPRQTAPYRPSSRIASCWPQPHPCRTIPGGTRGINHEAAFGSHTARPGTADFGGRRDVYGTRLYRCPGLHARSAGAQTLHKHESKVLGHIQQIPRNGFLASKVPL